MNNSLRGLKVLNTRPQTAGELLSNTIRAHHGIAIDLPTLEIQATNKQWPNDLPALNTVDYALFISANAVAYCFNKLNELNISWPKQIKVIAIGQATSNTLERYQINVAATPLHPNSEHLLTLSCLQQIEQKTIILFKGEGGRTLIEDELKKRQAQLVIIPVYKREMPAINYQFTNSLWRDNAVDIILLTSEQSIHNLFKLFSQETHSWLHNKPCIVISERLAQVATLSGIKKITISHPNRIIDTLFDYKDFTHGYTR